MGLWSVFDAHAMLYERYATICQDHGLSASDTYLLATSTDTRYAHLRREDGTMRIPTGLLLDDLWSLR